MKADVALQYAATLKAAAERAIAEGRDELTATDLEAFAAQYDAARAELEAAIRKADG